MAPLSRARSTSWERRGIELHRGETAKALGLTIPPSLLQREVIQ
jgi:hypothetical protein